MTSPVAWLLAVVMATSGMRVAPSDEAWAREVAEAAAKDIEKGRYEEATERLEKAYADKPLPAFLFILGRIEETRGQCESAIEHYEKFLESDVPPEDEKEARAGLERCKEALEPDVVEPQNPQMPDEPRKRWYADPLGGTFTALGLVGMGVGTGLLLQAQQDERAADDAGNLEDFDRHARRAEQWSQAGVITLGVGAGLLVVGIVRYAVVGARNRRLRIDASGVAVRF